MLISSAAACADPAADLLELGPTARSVVLIELREDGSRSALGVGVDSVSYHATGAPDGAQLVALVYPRPLAAILSEGRERIVEGPIALEAPGTAGTPFPPADRTLVAQIRERHAQHFVAVTELPEAARDLALPGLAHDPCVPFESRFVTLTGTVPPVSFAAIGERGVAVSLADRRMLYVDRATEAIEPFDPPGGAPWSSVWRAPDDTLWIETDRGLIHGTIEGGFETLTTTSADPIARQVARLIGPSRADAPFELFAVAASTRQTGDSLFARWNGAGWDPLVTGIPRSSLDQIGIAWSAPGEVFAVGLTDTHVTRLHAGQVFDEAVAPDARTPKLRSVLLHPSLGLVVGGGDATLALFDPAAGIWERRKIATNLTDLRFLVAIDDGLLSGGENGILLQYHPPATYCAERGLGAVIRDLIPIGDGFAALLDTDGGTRVNFLERK